jgi:hypothetical protein
MLKTAQAGKPYFAPNATPVINILSEFGKRTYSTTDSAATFYDRYKILNGVLYAGMTADFTATNAHNILIAGCNEFTIQPIGSAGTITVKGSLDGVTFVNTGITAGTDGFIRITAKYRWIQVSTSGSSGTYELYFMMS